MQIKIKTNKKEKCYCSINETQNEQKLNKQSKQTNVPHVLI